MANLPIGQARRIETLAAAFAVFEHEVSFDLDTKDRAEVRAVFYAGAQAVIDILDSIGADPEKRAATAKTLIQELMRFADEVQQRADKEAEQRQEEP